MPSPICFQMSGVYCLLVIREAHECISVACASNSEPTVMRFSFSTIIALSVASIAMPTKAEV